VSTTGDDRARLEVGPAVLTSPDGLVQATVGVGGTLGKLEFAPDTFERTSPAQLAYTVQALVQQLAEAPLTDGLALPATAPRPTPRRVRPRGAVPQNRRRGF
jgi:hypothetical protein